jgi:hypothetical protein
MSFATSLPFGNIGKTSMTLFIARLQPIVAHRRILPDRDRKSAWAYSIEMARRKSRNQRTDCISSGSLQ